MLGTSQGKEFFDLVKAIGESKSKQEEDRIIADEVNYLKKTFPLATNTKKKLKELIIRTMYVEMLGQDASFAYIKAVELCASTNLVQKKTGYLAASLCLSPEHEFRFMLVNQIQRDMNSANFLEASTALTAVCKLITNDMIPAVIGDVVKLLKHDNDSVRKKAVCALHRFYQLDKSSITDHIDKVRRSLCDKEPCVMGASLAVIHALAIDDAASCKDLVPSLVSILKQITDHRLPKDYDYHRIPAPWIQMHLLRILALLGRGDKTSSEGMYEVLAEVMKRADTGINVGYAVVFETVQTVTAIYPNPVLLDAAATAISRFIRSDSHNLKYIGIKGLASIVRDYPRYAADHQMAVIDCLEDPDETLKRKTLELLYRMTNSMNVEFIVDKLLSVLNSAADDHFRADLVGQITQCAERYAPSNAWYVQTVVKVFELAGDKVKPSVAQTLMQLIAEGSAEEEEEEEEEGQGEVASKDDILRSKAVDDFLELIEKPTLPAVLAQTITWILGEYGYLSKKCSKERVMEKVSQLAYRTDDTSTRAHCISALMKLVSQNGSCPSSVMQLITLYAQSSSIEVQQRCVEFVALLAHSETLVDSLPVDASCEDIQVDEKLSFLDGFVNAALAAGASPYNPPPSMLLDDDDDATTAAESAAAKLSSGFKVGPYEKPAPPSSTALLGGGGVFAGLNLAITPGKDTQQGGPGGVSTSSSSTTLTTGTTIASGTMTQKSTVAPTTSSASAAAYAPRSGGVYHQGNQLLNARDATTVWGKNMPPLPAATPATPTSAPSSSGAGAGTQQPSPSQHGGQTQTQTPGGGSGSSPPSTTPPKPRELTEREKMAAALFSGIASSSGKSAAPAIAKKRTSSLGGDPAISSPSITGIFLSPAPSPRISPLDSITTPVASGGGAGPVSVSPSPGNGLLFDLLDSGLSPVSSTATATSDSSSSSISTSGGVGSKNANPLLDMMMPAMSLPPPAAPTDHLTATLQAIQLQPQPNTPVTPHFQNNYAAVGITTSTASAVSTPMATLNGGGGAPHVSVSVIHNNNTTPIPILSPSAGGMSAAIGTPSLGVSVSTTPGGGGGGGGTRQPTGISLISSAKPLPINTAEFGQRWGRTPCEVKQSCLTKISSLDQLRVAVPQAHYCHVESIPKTSEAIFAGITSTTAPATTNTDTTGGTAGAVGVAGTAAVLVHIKLNCTNNTQQHAQATTAGNGGGGVGRCDVTVRTQSRELGAHEISCIALTLASFIQ